MKHPKKIQTGYRTQYKKTYDVEVEEVTAPGSCGEPEYLYHCTGFDQITLTDTELADGIADQDIRIIE